jgi:8-oxo-dGTP diphosphatase
MRTNVIEVVAAVIFREGKVLCVQRPQNSKEYISSKWEFPGGKVEQGEDRIQALKREIHEELQLEIQNIGFLTTVNHIYPDFHLVMHAYKCEISSGGPVLTEHVDLKWLRVEELDQLDWAAADISIVKFLQARG